MAFYQGLSMKTLNLPSLLYTLHTPALNPIIYTLRNKDLKVTEKIDTMMNIYLTKRKFDFCSGSWHFLKTPTNWTFF